MDRDLVEQARDGDREAYETLARAVAPRLYRAAYRMVRDAELAQDAVQVALVSIWRELPRLQDADKFEAWSYRIALRSAVNVLRSERGGVARLRVVMPEDVGGPDTTGPVQDREVLEQAFRRLTPEHRAIVVLRHYVGMTLEEVAEILEIPAGTARSRLHYALRAMRAALEADERPTATGRQTA